MPETEIIHFFLPIGDEGVETNIGAEGQESARRPSTSLQPPTSRWQMLCGLTIFFFEFRKRKFFIIFCFSSRRSSRPSSRESSQKSDRSVSFSKDLKTTKSAAGTAAHKSSKKSEELPPKKSKKERKRPDSRSSRSSSHSRSPTPKRERKKKKRHHHRKRKSDGKMIHFHNSLLHDPVNKVILQKKKISYF